MSGWKFTFAVVVYHAYNPPHETCRAIGTLGHRTTIFERESWGHLFKDLRQMYPGVEINVPDELPVIELDEHFREITAD